MMPTIEQMEAIWGPRESWISMRDVPPERVYRYELHGDGKRESLFLNLDELTEAERDIIISMSDKWEYGKQFMLQLEFVKRDMTK